MTLESLHHLQEEGEGEGEEEEGEGKEEGGARQVETVLLLGS